MNDLLAWREPGRLNAICRALLFGALVWLAVAAGTASAQSTGTIQGIVKDSSGGAVPDSAVVLTNDATTQLIRAATNATGTYSFAFLAPGGYSITVDHPGFARFVRQHITVDIAAVVVVDVNLQVGSSAQSVNVESQTAQLQTADSELSHVVDNTMMNALPLSSRNFTQILALSPGVTANVIDAGAIGRNSVNISANGARPWDNNVVLNGMNADNPMSQGFDDAPDKTGVPVPSPDAIEQFKVQTGLYDAEFGKEGGGTVNILTKSGTNGFHGTAFEFFRNTSLDANSFFQNASRGAKPIFRQNQYGGTLGGPVVKDKAFFFVSYQGTNQANGVSTSSNKTTFLPVLGDRSRQSLGRIYGGRAGVFGGAAVATDGSNINPVAMALVNAKLPNGAYVIPSPCVVTSATAGYCAISSPAIFNEKQIIADGDVSFTSKQRLSVKTIYSRDPETLPFQSNTSVLGFGDNEYHANTNVAAAYTYIIGPTIVNEIRAGYSRNLANEKPVEPLTAAQVGMTSPVPTVPGLASIIVNGMFTIGANRSNDRHVNQQQAELADTLSMTSGRQQLRFGGNVDPVRILNNAGFVQRGEIQIQSFPDFLLGMSGAQNGSAYSNLFQTLAGDGRTALYPSFNNFSLFAQDDFRVNDQLTLNLGLRYQFNGQAFYADGKVANYDFRFYPQGIPPAGGTLQGLVLPANVPASTPIPSGVTKLLTNTMVAEQNWLGISPRVGLAWRPVRSVQKLVVRVGYGIFYSAIAGTVQGGLTTHQPFYASVTSGGATNPTATFQNAFPNVPQPGAFPLYQPIRLGSNQTIYPVDPLLKQPRTQQYSGNIQTEIKGVLVQVGYVGSQTTNLIGFVTPNQAGLASPGQPINGQTTNTLANLLLRVPYVGFTPGADGVGEFMNTYCQSEQACSVNPYEGKPFSSRYNSFQLSATKRYSHGLSFSGAYTWSRAIDNIAGSTSGRQISLGSVTGDFHNPAVGRSNFNRTNVFTASYLWEIPRWNAAKGFAGSLINDWSISGVVIVESGLPFSITDSRGGTIIGSNGSYGQFASGAAPSDVSINSPTLSHYFNTAAFTAPPALGNGTYLGNSPRNFLTGPGFWNTALRLPSKFPFGRTCEWSFAVSFSTFSITQTLPAQVQTCRLPRPLG